MCKVHEIQVLMSINKILLKHSLIGLFMYHFGLLSHHDNRREFCDRGHVALRGENICHLAFRESLTPPLMIRAS